MNQSVKEIRTYQIAALAIMRCWDGCEIKQVQSPYYDFILTFKELDLVVGVEVKNSGFLRTKRHQTYLEDLAGYDVISPINKIPILLAAVNEEEESVQMGVLLGWTYGVPKVYFKPTMRELNQRNSDIILDEIKSMDDAIRLLSVQGMRVVKKIEISQTDHNGRICIGKIVYLRNFTEEYKMKTREIILERERVRRNTIGVPEDEYPEDFLDQTIFEMVQEKFPNCSKSSDLLLFSTDLKKLQLLSQKSHKEIACTIYPNLNEIDQNQFEQVFGDFKSRFFHLDLFIDNVRDGHVFEGIFLSKEFPLNNWYRTYQDYSKALLTMDSPNKLFNNRK